MQKTILKYAVHLVWPITLLGALVLLVLGPGILVWAGYHPNVPHAPYAIAIVLGSLLFVLCSAILGILFAIKRKTYDRERFSKHIGALLLVTLLSAIMVRAWIPPVPSTFVQHVGQVGYTIPRAFTSHQDRQPGRHAAVILNYCLNDWRGKYAEYFQDCNASQLSISERPVYAGFSTEYHLDSKLKIVREKDLITDTPSLARKMKIIPGDGWTGYTNFDENNGEKRDVSHIVLDDENRIVLIGICRYGSATCEIASRTRKGTIRYEFELSHAFQYQEWKRREEKIIKLLLSWQK